MARQAPKIVQRLPVPEPTGAKINTDDQSRADQAISYQGADGIVPANDDPEVSLARLHEFLAVGGDISDLLEPGVLTRLGTDAVREWRMDDGSRSDWKEQAERSLRIAAQETDEDSSDADAGLWENAADIHYPLLTTASQQFAARAGPELIKGDTVVGVKVFSPPVEKPQPLEMAKAAPQPQNPQQASIAGQQLQDAEQEQNAQSLLMKARQARGERVKHYLNFLVFYRMDDWEGDTDLLLHQIPITGSAFKKVYFGTSGLCSDYVSALRLTVANTAKSIYRAPRITEDFDVYPYEIEQRIRSGVYRDVQLPKIGEDPEQTRLFIEQNRLDDLDGDGLAEPYVVTVDVETQNVMSVQCAYTEDDVIVDNADGRVIRIDRFDTYSAYLFLPDPQGRFYGIGFGRLLDSITDSVDTTINQLLDAGTAEIAGGGFIGSSVRLQGSGQGGAVFFRPGEYQTVSTQGPNLREAIWERTVPHPSQVSFNLLEFLLAAAKDVASVKDVITGDAPSTAPVGTTLALQNQALQVFSAIYKRVYRGFRDEFRLMYRCLKRYATDKEKQEYAELTGGDFDKDFQGDGTDIQPVADPTVVTKMQKIARMQTVLQLAESPVGMAAGMTQSGPAQALITDALDILEVDRPERFIAPVPPNPLEVAKAQDLTSRAQLNAADAQAKGSEVTKDHAATNLDAAKALRELGMAAKDAHGLHQEADRIATTGTMQPPPDAEGANGPAQTPAPTPA